MGKPKLKYLTAEQIANLPWFVIVFHPAIMLLIATIVFIIDTLYFKGWGISFFFIACIGFIGYAIYKKRGSFNES